MRKDANSCCSHKIVTKGKLVPPIKFPLSSDSESDLSPHPFLPQPKLIFCTNSSFFGGGGVCQSQGFIPLYQSGWLAEEMQSKLPKLALMCLEKQERCHSLPMHNTSVMPFSLPKALAISSAAKKWNALQVPKNA